jgi:hypothetical protein
MCSLTDPRPYSPLVLGRARSSMREDVCLRDVACLCTSEQRDEQVLAVHEPDIAFILARVLTCKLRTIKRLGR